jgi:hypothetical protein
MIPHSFLCQFGFHRYDDADEFGRVWCSRCGKREPVQFAQIQAPEAVGRELNRAKTRGQKWK